MIESVVLEELNIIGNIFEITEFFIIDILIGCRLRLGWEGIFGDTLIL